MITVVPERQARADEAALAEYATALIDAVEATLPHWVTRSIEAVAAGQGIPVGPDLRDAAASAGFQARDELVPQLRALLARDVDDQPTGPLAQLRAAVRYPTTVLRAIGASPAERDSFAVRTFPDDVYGLTPASFADIDPALAEPGLVWGAAKAHVVLARRRREGNR